ELLLRPPRPDARRRPPRRRRPGHRRPRPRPDPRGPQHLAVLPRPPARDLWRDRPALKPMPLGDPRMTTVETKLAPPATAHVPRPYDGPPREEVLAMRREYLSPGLMTYY